MAYGSILGQNPTAQNTLYNNAQTSSIITANNVQGAIDQLFTSVSNGKQQIASAITDKGVSTSASDTFATMAENIGKISTGISLEALGNCQTFPFNTLDPIQIVPGMIVCTFYRASNIVNSLYMLFCDEKTLVSFTSRYSATERPSMNSNITENITTTTLYLAYTGGSGQFLANLNNNTITIQYCDWNTVRTCSCFYIP